MPHKKPLIRLVPGKPDQGEAYAYQPTAEGGTMAASYAKTARPKPRRKLRENHHPFELNHQPKADPQPCRYSGRAVIGVLAKRERLSMANDNLITRAEAA